MQKLKMIIGRVCWGGGGERERERGKMIIGYKIRNRMKINHHPPFSLRL